MTPTPEQIVEARVAAGLTQRQAAALVHVTERAWQRYESGERKLHPGLWELFVSKANTHRKGSEMKVITYQSPNGETIDLAADQVEMLESAGVWPRNDRGEEYCTVSHGLHFGVPTMSDAEVAEMCGK